MNYIEYSHRSCTGKVGHRSEKRAQNVCDTLRKGGYDEVFAYHCNICGKWHTGHRKKVVEVFNGKEKNA